MLNDSTTGLRNELRECLVGELGIILLIALLLWGPFILIFIEWRWKPIRNYATPDFDEEELDRHNHGDR